MKKKSPPDHQPREFDRRTSFIIVEYEVKEGRFRDILKNIGPKGLFIGTRRVIEKGQEITLRFPLFSFDQPVEVKGRVTRTTPHGFAVALDEALDGLLQENGRLSDIVHEIDR
jgi:hypothetical protein